MYNTGSVSQPARPLSIQMPPIARALSPITATKSTFTFILRDDIVNNNTSSTRFVAAMICAWSTAANFIAIKAMPAAVGTRMQPVMHRAGAPIGSKLDHAFTALISPVRGGGSSVPSSSVKHSLLPPLTSPTLRCKPSRSVSQLRWKSSPRFCRCQVLAWLHRTSVRDILLQRPAPPREHLRRSKYPWRKWATRLQPPSTPTGSVAEGRSSLSNGSAMVNGTPANPGLTRHRLSTGPRLLFSPPKADPHGVGAVEQNAGEPWRAPAGVRYGSRNEKHGSWARRIRNKRS